jgi:hypothetical protein
MTNSMLRASVALVALVCLVCTALLILDHKPQPPLGMMSMENWELVKLGMNKSEVDGIMGAPTSVSTYPPDVVCGVGLRIPPAGTTHQLAWHSKDVSLVLDVDAQGNVLRKTAPQTAACRLVEPPGTLERSLAWLSR